METFSVRSTFDVPVSELWRWHERPGAFERLSPPWEEMTLVERRGGLEVGARTVVRLKVGPVPQVLASEHTACERERLFRDEQREGPFARWTHDHLFSAEGASRSA